MLKLRCISKKKYILYNTADKDKINKSYTSRIFHCQRFIGTKNPSRTNTLLKRNF